MKSVGGQFAYRETFYYLRRMSYDVPAYDRVFMHTTTSVHLLSLQLLIPIAMSVYNVGSAGYCALYFLLRRSRFPQPHISRIAILNANSRQAFASESTSTLPSLHHREIRLPRKQHTPSTHSLTQAPKTTVWYARQWRKKKVSTPDYLTSESSKNKLYPFPTYSTALCLDGLRLLALRTFGPRKKIAGADFLC